MFPRRIGAMRGIVLGFQAGVSISDPNSLLRRESLDVRSKTLTACNLGMEKLRDEYQWSGIVEAHTYFRGFREGAESALRSLRMKTDNT